MNCSPPGSSIHGIFQTRILEWVAIPFSRASSQSRDWTWVSCFAGRFFTSQATIFIDCTSIQLSSVAQSCLTLCDPMDYNTPGLPIHQQLLEFTQTHVHRVGDAIEPPHPLSTLLLQSSIFPSIRVFSNESTLRMRWPASASVLPMNTQDWSPLGWSGWTSLQSKGLSRVFSNTTVQKHQFFGAQLSL